MKFTKAFEVLMMDWMLEDDASEGAASPLNGVFCGLLKTFPGEDRELSIEATDECDYTGYARQAVAAWAAQSEGADERRQSFFDPALTFSPTAATVGNTAVGWFLAVSGTEGADDILGFELFDEPVVLENPDQQVIINGRFALPILAEFGDSVDIV